MLQCVFGGGAKDVRYMCHYIIVCMAKIMTKVILFHEKFFENLFGYNLFFVTKF